MDTNKHKNIITAHSVGNYHKKFEEWRDMLLGEDKHSIRNQIYDMIWDCVFFQCINESRRYAAKDDKGVPKLNKGLHYFINQSFFKTQLLSIRKLTDKDFDKVRKNKQYTVSSLYNLVEDIKKNDRILTRKNILIFNDLPYDYERVMSDFEKNTDWTKGPVVVPNEMECSKILHKHIDSITKITASKRSPEDLVLNTNSFKCFDDWLSSSQELYDYVNKYIAHSATFENRRGISNEIEGALGKVLNAHKVICETATFIGNLLFGGFGEFLPFAQCDIFEYLDEPVASKETIGKLKAFWNRYRLETQEWYKQQLCQ
jgi:hypothetical protein